jgi:hypothetical protein
MAVAWPFLVYAKTSMEHWWSNTGRVKPKYSASVPVGWPQVAHGLTWDRTRASAEKGRRLTARNVARLPKLDKYSSPHSPILWAG